MELQPNFVRDEENIRTRTNFALFHDCFPGRIMPTDIDLAVEKDGGRFLFVEVKNPSAFIEPGQKIFLDKLAMIPRVTVGVVWGCLDLNVARPFAEHMRHWGVDRERRAVDLEGVRDWMRRWSEREWE